jgi:hypothetical protein
MKTRPVLAQRLEQRVLRGVLPFTGLALVAWLLAAMAAIGLGLGVRSRVSAG